jgi:2-oxoglutarate ferredoxin oxidoreductase subunit delta
MNKVTFRAELCKGCGLCIDVCPKKIIVFAPVKLNSKGFHPAQMLDDEAIKCIACAMCATMCPDCVIKVEKEIL